MRLTEPERTSPAANTPGRLVSYRIGGRASGQSCERDVVEIAPGEHEPMVVSPDDSREPLGARRGSNEDEQDLRWDGLGGAANAIAERKPLELHLPLASDRVGVESHLDVARPPDFLD